MVAVLWSKRANQDLHEIHRCISGDSIRYADREVARIMQRTRQLENFPKSGRLVPELNDELTCELIEGNYRIIYRIKPTFIRVLHIRHTKRLITKSDLRR